MNIKIESPDGLPANTKIYNADTGEEIDNVVAVTWQIRAGKPARCFIEISGLDVNMKVTAEDENVTVETKERP